MRPFRSCHSATFFRLTPRSAFPIRNLSLAAHSAFIDASRAPSWIHKMPLRVMPDFVTQEERYLNDTTLLPLVTRTSDRLVAELDPLLAKRDYEMNHWDSVIVGSFVMDNYCSP